MSNSAPTEANVVDLDPRIMSQFEKAVQNRDKKKFEYTIQVCGEWIKRYPNVVDFRKLLRDCQIQQKFPTGDFRSASKISMKSMVAQFSLQSRDPLKTLQNCERVFTDEPLDLKANEVLAKTASELGWTQTAIFGWQTLLMNPNRKPPHVLALAELYLNCNESQKVAQLCETFLKVFPNDASIMEVRNRASIQKSIHEV